MSKTTYIKGEITRIAPGYNNIFTVKSGNIFYSCLCNHEDFAAIENLIIEGRAINYTYKGKTQYEFKTPPELCYYVDKSLMTERLFYIYDKKWDTKILGQVYDIISEEGDPFMIIQGSIRYDKYRMILEDKIGKDKAETLIQKWKMYYDLPFFRSIGIPINKLSKWSILGKETYKFYTDQIVKRPFHFYKIKIPECEKLLKMHGKKYTEDDVIAGKIARNIDDIIRKRWWTYVPIHELDCDLRAHVELDNIKQKLVTHRIINIYGYGLSFEQVIKDEQFIYDYIKDLDDYNDIGIDVDNLTFKIKKLSRSQTVAIKETLKRRCSIITGAAGTGKTTIIAELVNILINKKIPYVCATFMGKAASRLKQSLTKILPEAEQDKLMVYTLDSLINKKSKDKYKSNKSNNKTGDLNIFTDVPSDCLNPKYVIIDEASMVTGKKLSKFLNLFQDSITNLVFVGDDKQLEPFYGWGRPFLSLIELKLINRHNLLVCHRTNPNSAIYINCDNIRRSIDGEITTFFTKEDEFEYHEGGKKKIYEIYSLLIGRYHYTDIKILSGKNKTCNKINRWCQSFHLENRQKVDSQLLNIKESDGNIKLYDKGFSEEQAKGEHKVNEERKENQNIYVQVGVNRFYVGDVVMMTKNDYRIGIMNGDEGVVEKIDIDGKNSAVSVYFKDLNARYRFKTMDKNEEELMSKYLQIDDEIYHVFDRVSLAKELKLHIGENKKELHLEENEIGTISDIDIVTSILYVKFMNCDYRLTFTKMDPIFKIKDRNINVKFIKKIKNKGRIDGEEYKCNIKYLKLSYSLTIHKSQGSEYECVIFYANREWRGNKNLVYTAITRAKNELHLIDHNKEIMKGTANLPDNRYEYYPEKEKKNIKCNF